MIYLKNITVGKKEIKIFVYLKITTSNDQIYVRFLMIYFLPFCPVSSRSINSVIPSPHFKRNYGSALVFIYA